MTLRHLLGVGCALAALSATGARADQAAFNALAKSTSGLIGYWSWEGNYEDQSGKGNHAKANGDPSLIKFVAGVKGGQAVELDNQTADTQYLSVAAPVGSTFDTPNQTVLVWAKSNLTKDAGEWDNIIDRANLWYMDTLYSDVGGATKLDLVCRIYGPSTPADQGSGQVPSSAAATPVYLAPTAWSFVGWTYDGKVMTTYVDGKVIRQVNYTGGLGPTAATPLPSDTETGNYDLFWGAWRGQPGYSISGDLDDTVIYNRALTADEVKALYDSMLK
jgi:Concanavalin A-like lectin/glucanases superfamily